MSEFALARTTPVAAPDFPAELRQAVRDARRHMPAQRNTFHRIIVKAEALDPLEWVRRQNAGDRFFWSSRDHGDRVAGVGSAAIVESSGRTDYGALRRKVQRVLARSASGTRFFGGIRFDDTDDRAIEWRTFPTYRFVVPRFEIRTVGEDSIVACNVSPSDDYDAVLDEIDALRGGQQAAAALPAFVGRSNLPDRVDWKHAVEWALSAFSSTALAKVVLGRRVRLSFDGDLDAFEVIARLRSITPSCYHFIFSTHESAFIGASPEMLFRQVGSSIRSEAVAGTAPRGETEGADLQLSRRLLLSEKDQREHEYVRQSIKEGLNSLTRVLHVDTTASDMKLAQGRHLRSSVDGVLAEGVDAVDLLRALHPTPAVGGHPHEDAMEAIRHIETFDRGWYAGPIGWIADGASEFAVGIRSGLCHGPTLDVFSGAGIVCGSDPDLEWMEIEQKIGDFIRALELDRGR